MVSAEEKLKKALNSIAKYKKAYDKKHKTELTLGLGKDLKDKGFGKITAITTGVTAIDILLAGGMEKYAQSKERAGWTKGRFGLVEGPAGAGKTTLCYRTIAEAQKAGLIAAYVNVENSYDPQWARINGVNTDLLIGGEFDSAESGLDFIIGMAKANSIDLLVYDSVVGMASSAEYETKAGKERDLHDDSVALIPRILSQFFRISTRAVAKSDMVVLFTNQVRVDINAYGAPEMGPGGNALKHHLSNRIFIRPAAKKEWPENGVAINATVTKSNIGALVRHPMCIPFIPLENGGTGYDNDSIIVDIAHQAGLIPFEIDQDTGEQKNNLVYTDIEGEQHRFRSINTLRLRVAEAGLIPEIKERIFKNPEGVELKDQS
jgi:RecA/RadA recombinase